MENPDLISFDLPQSRWPEGALITRTNDLSEAGEAIGRIYCPYRFEVASQQQTQAQMYNLNGLSVSLSRFSYGAEIDIVPDDFERFLLVLTTLRGGAEIIGNKERATGLTGATFVTTPAHRWRFRYTANNQQFVARLDFKRVREVAQGLSGKPLPGLMQFPLVMLSPQLRQRWHAQLANMAGLLANDIPVCTRDMLLPRAEEMLIATLLLEHSDFSIHQRHDAGTEITPGILKRAIAHIEENLDQSLTLVDIANAARCSVRSLHRTFKSYRGITVMQFVKNARLQRVHDELSSTTGSITETALHWGFTHLGQFSIDYRRLFGEKPSETAKRSQQG